MTRAKQNRSENRVCLGIAQIHRNLRYYVQGKGTHPPSPNPEEQNPIKGSEFPAAELLGEKYRWR